MKRETCKWLTIGAGSVFFLSVFALIGPPTTVLQNSASWACPLDMTKKPPQCRKVVIWGELCTCY